MKLFKSNFGNIVSPLFSFSVVPSFNIFLFYLTMDQGMSAPEKEQSLTTIGLASDLNSNLLSITSF